MKNITINILSKCSAKCKHCCFSCTPNSKDYLSDDEVWNIVEYAINDESIKEISITGGEPFLKEDLVFKILAKASKHTKSVTCITNGFWATSYQIARNKLVKLSALGLRLLTISYDDFHAEYIPIQNIKNILKGALQLKIRIALNMSVTKSKTGIKILEELKDDLLGCTVTRFSVAPVGEGKKINHEQFYYKLNLNEPILCSEPTSGMVIHHDGYVYPCCSPLVFETNLRIDSIRCNDLKIIRNKFYNNILLYIIRKEGLNWFVSKCKQHGYNIFKKEYISSCELCNNLFKDNKIIDLLYNDIMDYYDEQVL